MLSQIQQCLLLPFADQVANGIAYLDAALSNGDPSFQVQNVNASHFMGRDCECHGYSSFELLMFVSDNFDSEIGTQGLGTFMSIYIANLFPSGPWSRGVCGVEPGLFPPRVLVDLAPLRSRVPSSSAHANARCLHGPTEDGVGIRLNPVA